ncbi:MAG: helix-turn-helix domain-containing protein, partial [Planctomycetota bacterium]
LCHPIVAADCRRLRACVAEADACLRHSDPRNALHGQRILVELCLLALRDLPRQSLPGSGRDDAGRVALALDWYREHMHEGPGIAAVARAVYCSPAHLRRLFHRELGRSPAAALAAERWQRACTLLLESEDGLDAIATACGYADATALSRAFKRHCGRSPRVWRKQPRGAV